MVPQLPSCPAQLKLRESRSARRCALPCAGGTAAPSLLPGASLQISACGNPHGLLASHALVRFQRR